MLKINHWVHISIILLLLTPACNAEGWIIDDSECGVIIRWMQNYKGFPAKKIIDAHPINDWKHSRCKVAPQVKTGYYLRGACEGEVMPENKGILFWTIRSRKMGASDFIDEGLFRICK